MDHPHITAQAARSARAPRTLDLIFSLSISTALVALTALVANAQTGVAIGAGNPTAHASAVLDVQSTSQGFLVPRMTTAQRTAISSPAPGLMVFDITTNSPWYFANGIWQQVGTMAAWGLAGNSGTDPNMHFIGTTDSNPLMFRSTGASAGHLTWSSTAFGVSALNAVTSGSGVCAFGKGALSNLTSGNGNTAMGDNAGGQITIGTNNTAVGRQAMQNLTSGSNNTAIGQASMFTGLGNENVGVGANSLSGNLNAVFEKNVALGFRALYSGGSGTFARNTAVGHSALDGTSASDNTAVGHRAMFNNTTGSQNTAVGVEAMMTTNTGFNNVAVGYASLKTNTTGSYHTSVGRNTGPNGNNYVNTTCIGIDATATASNQVRIGNTFVTSIGGQVGWSTLSDGRFKRDVSENVPGLDFIKHLRPVTYRVDNLALRKAYGIEDGEERSLANEPGSLPISELTTGFIAQEVEAAARAAGFTFSGVDVPKNDGDTYALRYAEFVVPLVKAVQEQQALIDALVRRIETLEGR